jgi:hypothetical protein
MKDRTRFEDDFKISDLQKMRNRWVLWREFDLIETRKTTAEEKKDGVDQFDFEATTSDDTTHRFEFKNWENVPLDKIVIETDHDVHSPKDDGWIWYGPDHWDWLVGVWHKQRNYSYVILDGEALRAWWQEVKIDAKKNAMYRTRTNKQTWKNGRPRNQSGYVMVPIDELPDRVVKCHRRQTTIDNWGDSKTFQTKEARY